MKNYINHVVPYKSSFRQIRVNRRELLSLQNVVITHLKLRDLGELRDKFEGQAFLNNFMQKALPLMGLQKYLKTDLIDFQITAPNKVKEQIMIDGNLLRIVYFEADLPLIDTADNLPCIFIHSTHNQMLELCGFASAETVKSNLIDIKRTGFGSKETIKGSFQGFDQLKMFDSIEELMKLVKA